MLFSSLYPLCLCPTDLCWWAIRHALLRTFAYVVTSTLNIFLGLDLAASFAILFPALKVPFSEKPFLFACGG